MGLEFIQRRFNLPALVIQGSQFRGWCRFVIQNGGQQSVDGLGSGNSLQGVFDHPDYNSVFLVTLIFVLSSHNYPFFQLLTVASVVVGGCIGAWYVWRGMLQVNLVNERALAKGSRALMRLWFVLYAFVGSQMAWRLSPFVGDPARPFVWLQPSRDNLYVDVIHVFERVAGLQQIEWSGARMWIGGLSLIVLALLIVGAGVIAGLKEA